MKVNESVQLQSVCRQTSNQALHRSMELSVAAWEWRPIFKCKDDRLISWLATRVKQWKFPFSDLVWVGPYSLNPLLTICWMQMIEAMLQVYLLSVLLPDTQPASCCRSNRNTANSSSWDQNSISDIFFLLTINTHIVGNFEKHVTIIFGYSRNE